MLKYEVHLNNIENRNWFGVGGVAKLFVQTSFLLRDKDKEVKVGRQHFQVSLRLIPVPKMYD